MIDCAKIIFSIIRLHEHNVIHLLSDKSTVTIICTFDSRLLVFDQSFLSAYGHIHGNWVPLEVTQDSSHRTQRMRITSSVTQNGVRVLVVKFFALFIFT